ncbi:TRAP transporter small permease [Jannaschia aquimarina]|uniref:TRAP transporter small permease protein n=1 Tax=Jannaschia aquimarina TaxID=935700 RepID=A0A0D1DD15_9RHOB|nr:TRAP transporter small permease [Jannaschia aquimarina]KIT17868.1 Tripartite ATP-independent periplasmic transporter, DctQ component [Jannaschia aquimarina]SNS56002.1 Tripartite ATP-independent transporter, DctQ component [Jannaschia aquimarina]
MLARIERLLLDLSVFAIAGLGLLITANVVARAAFNTGIPDAIVMVRELMVAAIVLPLAAATAARSHIVVEFVTKMMPARLQDYLIVFGSLFGLFALAPLIWAGWREAASTLQSGTFFFGELSLPKWPGRVVFLVGLSFCWLRLAVMVAGDLRTIRAGGHLDAPETAKDLLEDP